ncbi:hypothetical protein BKA70DRAFT_1421363 [Coprinopsis sp. MPI-PUGE-AT-0042]|nr:hypothetical protein BKA70DRAFT_1421363 [Coprinopsis sp. MPI-PUGE-AT-0042]
MNPNNDRCYKDSFFVEDYLSPVLRPRRVPPPLSTAAAFQSGSRGRSRTRRSIDEVPTTASVGDSWANAANTSDATSGLDDVDNRSTHLSDEMGADYAAAAFEAVGYDYPLISTFSTPRTRSPSRAGPSNYLTSRFYIPDEVNQEPEPESEPEPEPKGKGKGKAKGKGKEKGRGKGKQKQKGPDDASGDVSEHSLHRSAPQPQPHLRTPVDQRSCSRPSPTPSFAANMSTTYLSPTSNTAPTIPRSSPSRSRGPSRSRRDPDSIEFRMPTGIHPKAIINRDEMGSWTLPATSRVAEDHSHFSDETHQAEPDTNGEEKTKSFLQKMVDFGITLKRGGRTRPTPQPTPSTSNSRLPQAANRAVDVLKCENSPNGCHRYSPVLDNEHPCLACDYCGAIISLDNLRRILQIGVEMLGCTRISTNFNGVSRKLRDGYTPLKENPPSTTQETSKVSILDCPVNHTRYLDAIRIQPKKRPHIADNEVHRLRNVNRLFHAASNLSTVLRANNLAYIAFCTSLIWMSHIAWNIDAMERDVADFLHYQHSPNHGYFSHKTVGTTPTCDDWRDVPEGLLPSHRSGEHLVTPKVLPQPYRFQYKLSTAATSS